MPTLCPSCGFNNPNGMRFCGNCGSKLPAEELITGPKVSAAPALDPSGLGVMTGSDLLDRFRRAGLEASGQRRSVTVLFVDLSDYTHLSEELGDEVLYDTVQQFINLLIADVHKYEGMVDKLTGDGLMALFGAPIAYENNAERAVRAAMDMVADVERLSASLNLGGRELRIHVGLNAGSVIVGGVGGDGHMNYTAIGDVVNLARRLEESARPGAILVSESVYRQTTRLFDYDRTPTLALKNVSRSITAFQLIGPKAHPGSVRGLEGLRAPMIGREEELNRLLGVVERTINDRQGGVVLLVGEGGMGKSRLTSELKGNLNASLVHVLEGHSLTYRKAIAYWIFQDVLRSMIEVSPESEGEETREKLAETCLAVLGEAGREKMPYLEHMLGMEPSDPEAAERIRYLEPGQLRQQIFLAVRDLLVAESRRRPLLLVLEDLHWADDASLDLIRFLIDSARNAPLLILAITRPFEGGAVQAIHERAGQRLGSRYLRLQLQALPPEQSNRLLEALLTIPDLPASLQEEIVKRSAGLPFYLEEILRMLIENNIIFRDPSGGNWRLTPGADVSAIGVPDTLQGLILARFDRLPPNHRRMIQTASVVGYEFSVPVLLHVLRCGSEDESWLDTLDLLVEREFLLPIEGAEETFRFKHVLVSDAVYSTLLVRDRRGLHTQVGQALEYIYSDRIDSQIEVLASHFLRSPLLDRALHYLTLAGQKAARSFANEQARLLFMQALEVLNKVDHSVDQATQVHLGLGDALLTAGDYPQAREQFHAALRVQGEPTSTGALRPLDEVLASDDRAQRDRVRLLSLLQRKIGATHERQGEYEKALACLRSAQSLIESRKSSFIAERASIMNDIGFIDFRKGSLDRAEALLRDALALAESVRQIDVVASIMNRLAGIYYQRDQIDLSTRYMGRSLTLREQIGDVVGVARSYNNLGLIRWKQGDLVSALENFTHAFKLQANLGDVEGSIVLHNNIGLIELDRGSLSEAEQHFKDALDLASEIGHSYYVCLSRMNLALQGMYSGCWDTSLAYAQESLKGFQELSVQENQLDLYWVIGTAYRGLNDTANLDETLGKIGELLAEEAEARAGKGSRPSDGEGRVLRLFARVARDRGRQQEARDCLERSAAIFEKVGNRMEHSRTQMELAGLMAAGGEKASARALLTEARGVFTAMGARLELERLKGIEEFL